MSFIADSFFRSDPQHPRFQFSNQDAGSFAQALRSLADAVDKGDVVLQEIRNIVRSKSTDYVMSSLILRYAEKR